MPGPREGPGAIERVLVGAEHEHVAIEPGVVLARGRVAPIADAERGREASVADRRRAIAARPIGEALGPRGDALGPGEAEQEPPRLERVGRPLPRILAQQARDGGVVRFTQLGVPRAGRRIETDRVAHRRRCSAGEQLGEEHAHAVDVARDARGAAEALLGRHVGEGADRARGGGAGQIAEVRGAEVGEARRAHVVEEHGGRLHVAVEDAEPVRFTQRGEHRAGDLHPARRRHGLTAQAIGE